MGADLRLYLEQELEKTKIEKNKLTNMPEMANFRVKGFSDFFSGSKLQLKFEYGRQLLELNNEKLYLSLFEKTTNFTTVPETVKTTVIGNTLCIDANIQKDLTINCNIIVIFYDKEQQIKAENISLNKNSSFDIPENARSYRVALLIEGTGKIHVDEINIKQKYILKEKAKANQFNNFVSDLKFDKQVKVENFKKSIKSNNYYRTFSNQDLKVACILDEFSFESFKYDCQLVQLTKGNWKSEIDSLEPDFLFVESSWQGNSKQWEYEIANLHKNKHRIELKKLVDYCNSKKIQTVFWDKEGVENFHYFEKAASYFDHIFTADENNIENFKLCVKHNNVFELPFAAQFQIHNPIYKNKDFLGELAFGGSYYNNKHEERKVDIENLIKPALKFDIQIFDRYFQATEKTAPNNQWPNEYKKNIVGNLAYNEMVEAYKNYDIFFTVNSVQNSKYMFARRVFEILASKSMVISGPSMGVKELLGNYVPISQSQRETEQLLKIYTKNPILRDQMIYGGLRDIWENHTHKNRLQHICDKLNLKKDLLKTKKVTIISATQREEFIENLYNSINSQTYKNFNAVIVLNKNNMNLKKWNDKFKKSKINVQILQLDENLSLGSCINEAINRATGEVIAKFDDDDYYAPNYLKDMLIAMDYSNAALVGKSEHYIYFENKMLLALKKMGKGSERYTDFVAGATLVFNKEIVKSLGGFADKNRGEDSDLLKRIKESGNLIYSSDSYNFCALRRSDLSSHTWKVNDDELLRNCYSHSFTKDYSTPVTI